MRSYINTVHQINTNTRLSIMMDKLSVIEDIDKKYLEERIEQIPPTESEIAAEFGMALAYFK